MYKAYVEKDEDGLMSLSRVPQAFEHYKIVGSVEIEKCNKPSEEEISRLPSDSTFPKVGNVVYVNGSYWGIVTKIIKGEEQ